LDPNKFDPVPPGLDISALVPNENCHPCKWVPQNGKLTCSSDARRDHEYKITWRCPSSGVERLTTKRAPARSPCTPPPRRPARN
jgi:hypothetical protein